VNRGGLVCYSWLDSLFPLGVYFPSLMTIMASWPLSAMTLPQEAPLATAFCYFAIILPLGLVMLGGWHSRVTWVSCW
jgi:hypothetical protein